MEAFCCCPKKSGTASSERDSKSNQDKENAWKSGKKCRADRKNAEKVPLGTKEQKGASARDPE